MSTVSSTIGRKLRGVVYIRVSTDEQAKGTSPEFQKQECIRYCANKNIDIIAIFEEAETSKDLSLNNREEFLRALDFSSRNKIDAFIVYRVDRFARNTTDHFAVRKILLTHGTTLHSVTEPIGNTPSEKLLETILAGVAEFDNAIRAQRCKDGISTKINQGISLGRPKFGYTSWNFRKKDEKKSLPDKPDIKRLPIIKRLFLAVIEEGITSNKKLAELANQWGLTTISGKKIYPQIVDRLLSNIYYAGKIYNSNTQKIVDGKHESVVTLEEFNKVQLIRKGKLLPGKQRRSKNNPNFPLTKTIRCFSCSLGVSGSASRGNGGVYSNYHCRNKKCELYGKTLPKNIVESDFIKLLETISPRKEFMSLFNEVILDVAKMKMSFLDEVASKQNREIEELKKKKEGYAELMVSKAIDINFGKELIDKIDIQIVTKQISANECQVDKISIEELLLYANKTLSDLAKLWLELDIDNRKKFQQLIFPEGIIYQKKKGVGTPKLGLIFELNRESLADKTHYVLGEGVEPS